MTTINDDNYNYTESWWETKSLITKFSINYNDQETQDSLHEKRKHWCTLKYELENWV